MKVNYNIVNMFIGNVTINIHDNFCCGDSNNNFTAFVWNSHEPLMTELQQRIEKSERETRELMEKLNEVNRQAVNQQSVKL